MPLEMFPAPFIYLFGHDFEKFIPFAEFFLRTFFSRSTTRNSPCAVPPVGIGAQTRPHERFGRLFICSRKNQDNSVRWFQTPRR